MATDSKISIKRGFPHICPMCQEENTLALNLDDCATLRCRDCEEEVTVSDLRKRVEQYGRILAWIDSIPGRE